MYCMCMVCVCVGGGGGWGLACHMKHMWHIHYVCTYVCGIPVKGGITPWTSGKRYSAIYVHVKGMCRYAHPQQKFVWRLAWMVMWQPCDQHIVHHVQVPLNQISGRRLSYMVMWQSRVVGHRKLSEEITHSDRHGFVAPKATYVDNQHTQQVTSAGSARVCVCGGGDLGACKRAICSMLCTCLYSAPGYPVKRLSSSCSLTWRGCCCKAWRTSDAVVYTIPAALKGVTVGRGSKRSGWLQT